MTMILNLDALQLNVSPFGRKYLQNNGIHDMARLRTIASKTQPSQLKVHYVLMISLVLSKEQR